MTTWTPLSNTTLAQDKPLTQSVVRALRDNPISIGEAATGAPRTDPSSFKDLAFFAYKSANQTISSSIQDLTFDTEEFDGSNWYDPTTGKFTPQSPGLYCLNARVDATISTGNTGNFHIAINGSQAYDILEINSLTAVSAKLIALIRFNGTTDYATVRYSNGNSSATIKGAQKYYSHFFGFKVGP